MIQHGKILVPTDFSEQADEALRRAGVLAGQFGAEVHLVHVLEPVVFFETDLVSVYPMDEIVDAMRKGAQKRLAKQADAVEFDVITHLNEALGDPSQEICDFAGTLPTDLIVVGRHGRQGILDHMLIGSTAERVVRHAPCSVLVTMPHGLLENTQD
jgi:nucleotide-binding universal stress UspA family protein